MASLGEYCSLWPCAGGQQFYTLVLPTYSFHAGPILTANENRTYLT